MARKDEDLEEKGEGKLEESRGKRWLETIAAFIGAVLALSTIGIIVWDGVRDQGRPALISLRTGPVHQHEGRFVVEVVARNSGDTTAAELLVEGALKSWTETVETSEVTFDYVPSRSSRTGALYFTEDPRRYDLQLRAVGYRDP
jgi:uncharacterized protein (TIGR02588 family)